LIEEQNTDAEIADFSNQGIEDLEPLLELVFAKMPNLRELNLSNNLISYVPSQFADYVSRLESINLNNNQIP
jgi:Leucine-rich repeat (LRR) protein